MYCPRCNLHSREYVDRCPLCEGPMEVDEAGSAVMKTPVMSDKDEGTDDFFQEASFSLPEEKARKDLSLASTIAMEIDQDFLDARKEGDTVRLLEPEEASAPVEEEPQEPETTQPIFVREPPEDEGQEEMEEPSKSRIPILLAIVLLVCILGGLGYWFFLRPQGPSETKVAMTTPEPATIATEPATPPALAPEPAVSEQPALSSPTPPEVQAPEAASPVQAPIPAAPAPEEAKAPAPAAETAPLLPVESKAPAAAPAAPPAAPETKEVKVAAARPAAPPEPSAKKPAPEPPKAAIAAKEPSVPSGQLPAPSEDGRYSVHVGSFKVEANAFALRDKLQKKGYPVICALVSIPEKGDWYRVRVGYYPGKGEASQVAARLQKEEKLSAVIFNKR